MNDVLKQIGSLSPEKRRLLEQMLKKDGVDLSRSMILPRPQGDASLALSFSQQRLWFLDQLEPMTPLYNIPTAVRIRGALKIEILERSLNEMIRRHEALRTSFSLESDQPRQVIADELLVDIPLVDCSETPADRREARALEIASQEAQTPFDMTTAPLFRVKIIRLSLEEHWVVLTMHHIISDGWSIAVFIKELVTLYDSFARGLPSPLPPLSIQYADYAYWQKNHLQGEFLAEQLAYWKQKLGDIPPVLELPADHHRPALQTSRGAVLNFNIPKARSEALKSLCRQTDTTLFMTLLALFDVLLFRSTQQDDIAVGTPIANRGRAEIENLIGFFVNTLVIRSDLSGNPSFKEVLKRVRENALDAYAHQDVPFEILAKELHPSRDLSHTPFFQVMFVLQNAPVGRLETPGLQIESVDLHSNTSTFDLTLMMGEAPDGLSGTFEYNADLFEEATIARMVGHFEQLLNAALADPDCDIAALPMLSETERQRLVEWNQTTRDYPLDQCLHQLFENRARITPDAIALIWPATPNAPRQQMTYRELEERSNQLAHYLRQKGASPRAFIGLCVDRSFDLIVGLLAILKSGSAYLPLDPSYPVERLAFMIEDSQIPILLTKDQYAGQLPAGQASVVRLDVESESIARMPLTPPENGVTSDDPAYLIYTSGSTGVPKGTIICHRSVINHNHFTAELFQTRRDERVLQFSTINFDAAVEEIFPTWLAGAALVLRPSEQLISGNELLQLVENEQINILDFPTAFWQAWTQELAAAGSRVPESVRVVAIGGEKAQKDILETWHKLGGDRSTWINTYGPTETTIIVTSYSIAPGDKRWKTLRDIPIGKPIANSQTYILDPRGQPVPIGIPGELYIGGVPLAKGYLNRPELTNAVFVPDPFHPETGQRLYKTGDLARYLEDGNIEFVGRVDHQVKIRGFRVELGEIETLLNQHPAVQQAVVIDWVDPAGQKRLAAYIVAHPSVAQPAISDLARFLKESLPEYMIPAAFVFLDAIPLTPNGKLARKLLPTPDGLRPDLESVYTAPRSPAEEMLAGIWSDILGLSRVGVHDNFFDLGGHSLLATQLAARARAMFQVDMPVRAIFEAPTVAALAEWIENARKTALDIPIQPITPTPRGNGSLPLSFAQQRLWFLDQLEPGSFMYTIPDTIELTGNLNIEALETSLNEVIRRHEILRTIFPASSDGKARQEILSHLTITLPVVDLQHLDSAQRESEARRLAQDETRQPFDLSSGPLMRAKLLKMAPDRHILLFNMHHIITDGWSSDVLIQEVSALYQSYLNQRPSPLPELPIQYADFAAWQRAWLSGEVLDQQLSYWKSQLADLATLELPTDHPRPPVPSYDGSFLPFELPADLSGSLRALSQSSGSTLFMTLLAAFQVLLFRYSGKTDIPVGSPIANRNRADIENLIGFFVNTLVLRGDLSGDPSFIDLLARTRETALAAYAHQDLPFEMIVDKLLPNRNLSHSPLFEVMFVLQNAAQQSAISLSDLSLSPIEVHSGTAKFDLTLFVNNQGEALSGALEYNTDLFDRATIKRMISHFVTLLQAAVANPTLPISRLPILSSAERALLIDTWNDAQLDFPRHLCTHHLFEQQVLRSPDAPALLAGELSLSYAELNARANQLAHYLQSMGVGPEVLVGVCMERSLEMIVALLGVLKSGAAYIPLDPNSPAERISFIIQDASMPVLLTQRRVQEALLADLSVSDTMSILALDARWDQVASFSADNPSSSVTPENLAYVIYTSGSTGRPKGAMILHRGLVNYLSWCAQVYPVSSGSGTPLHSSFTFDLAVTSLFATLFFGTPVHLLPEELGVEALGAALQSTSDFGLIKITPAHLQLLSQQVAPSSAAACTRAFIIGGENLLVDHVHFWQRFAPDTHLVNEYGPTETVVGCCVYWAPLNRHKTGVIPIGRPIINTRLYILDANLQPVPIGVPAELFIGGEGVARGYLNRPDLTAEKFLPDPFSSAPDARMYRTGDLVRILPDGNIECLGRIDFQVKIRGYRVELGEIESHLDQHELVKESVVWVYERGGVKHLVAYVVPLDPQQPGSPEVFKAYLANILPDYMVPNWYIPLEALPLSHSGKVNRNALPAPDFDALTASADFAAPQSEKERILAGIWSAVLGISQVSVNDNFFELGGDSILSIQVIARARQSGLHLSPRLLFEHPTIAGLAANATHAAPLQTEQGTVTGSVPLTPIQTWFFEQNLPNPGHWNQSILLSVPPALHPESLQQVLTFLLAHHDALRMTFSHAEQGWQQVNAGLPETQPFTYFDLSALSEHEQLDQLSILSNRIQAALDLQSGVLLHTAYFDFGPQHPGRLLFAAHHLVIDGVSWRILLEDFAALYQQTEDGLPLALPPKSSSFQAWAQHLDQFARSEALLAELPFWRGQFTPPPPPIPIDFQLGSNSEASAASLSVSLSQQETTALLEALPEVFGTRINDALLAALALALSDWSHSNSAAFDLETHGREDLFEDLDLSRTVGWFTAVYPLVINLTSRDPEQTLKQVKEQLRAVPNNGIGFGLLRYLSGDASLTPLPQAQVSFNYLGQSDQTLQAADAFFAPATEDPGLLRDLQGVRAYLIDINAIILDNRLQVEWSFSRNFHTAASIQRLADRYIQSLRDVITLSLSTSAPQYTPSDFNLVQLDQSKLDKVLKKIGQPKG